MMLYLIPTSLQEKVRPELVVPATLGALDGVRVLAVENLRTCRRFLKAVLPASVPDDYTWLEYDKHTGRFPIAEIKALWQRADGPVPIGLMSEAGYPAVGDPGTEVVALAHQLGVPVLPLPGSCSFLMALAGSGLPGQRFAFYGYLPVEEAQLSLTIKSLEADSARLKQTQIVMDTPYRNARAWAALVTNLKPTARLCLALDLEGEHQRIENKAVREWKNVEIDWQKRPAVFLFSSGG